jgi:hypothetical protein
MSFGLVTDVLKWVPDAINDILVDGFKSYTVFPPAAAVGAIWYYYGNPFQIEYNDYGQMLLVYMTGGVVDVALKLIVTPLPPDPNP